MFWDGRCSYTLSLENGELKRNAIMTCDLNIECDKLGSGLQVGTLDLICKTEKSVYSSGNSKDTGYNSLDK
jgi:hypothetical protein